MPFPGEPLLYVSEFDVSKWPAQRLVECLTSWINLNVPCTSWELEVWVEGSLLCGLASGHRPPVAGGPTGGAELHGVACGVFAVKG